MNDPLSRLPAGGAGGGVLIGRVGEGLLYALEGDAAKDMQLRQYAPFDEDVARSPELDEALARGAQAFLELGRRLIELREARIGRIYDVIEEDGRAFWVTAAPGGPSLEDELVGGAALSPAEVARLAADAAQGLGALHLAGLLHRDVAPQTLVRASEGGWTLTGCSTDRRPLMKPAGGQEGLYRPSYAAPEMQDGSLRQALTEATDVYALCATLRHAMTGQPPPIWMERLKGAPSLASLAPAPYPPELLALIDRGLSPRPGERFATVEAWWDQARPRFETLGPPVAATAPATPGVAPIDAGPTQAAPVAEPESLPVIWPGPLAAAALPVPIPAKVPAAPPTRGLFAGRALKGWALAGGAIILILAGIGFLSWLAVQPHRVTYYASRTAVVRAAPDPHAAEIERQPRGSKLTGKVQASGSGTPWLAIDLGSGRKGFVSTKSLGLKPPPTLDESAQGSRRLVRDAVAREAPDASSPAADSLGEGDAVRVTGRTPDGWYEVLRPAGGVEYLASDAFTPVATASAAPSSRPSPPASSAVAAVQPPHPSASPAAFGPAPSSSVSRPPLSTASQAGRVLQAPPPEIRSVAIVRKPTAADIQRAYPRAALLKDQPGSALIDCAVGADGGMRDCQVVGANPGGEGFEEAARQLGALYVVRGVDQDGQPTVGRRITFEIKFAAQKP